MRREPHIPLFLWVTAALVAHGLGGGGATKVAEQLEETLDIGSFASEVRAKAKFVGPLEVTLEASDQEEEPEEVTEEDNPEAPLDDAEEAEPATRVPESDDSDSNTNEEVDVDEPSDEKDEPDTPKAEEEKKKPTLVKPEDKPEDKPPELLLGQKPQPKVVPNRRIAVEQHVQDKDQEDNPNAEFAGEHANRVEDQTQARITSTDQNATDPTAGAAFAGTQPDPGNSEESRVAQSDENDGADDQATGAAARAAALAAASSKRAPAQQPGTKVATPDQPAAQAAQAAREAKSASDAQSGMIETHNHGAGSFSIAKAQEAQSAQAAQKARQARARILALQKKKQQPLLGFGSGATTERGVRLNLSQDMAHAVIGHDHLDSLKERVGKRRLSKHRGSWQNIGLERWRGALENYVANVKPGNQTALNTARVPFARYLNQIHQQLHEVFAHGFLGHLEQLPAKHPLNNQEMSTHLEIALSREDGRIVKMGITKSSGVTAFDVGALESVSKAAPYGPPPGSIVSSDGNVYLHWEFHRNRNYACSTYFARPYIIDVGQQPAAPRVDPPPKPNYDEKKKPDERSGALETKPIRALAPRPG